VADNTGGRAFAGLEPTEGLRVVPARGERSSYFARNVGAEATNAPWLLFIDSDCRPRADLLDRHFEPGPHERTGVVAGAVRAAAHQTSLAASYATSRRHLDEAYHLAAKPYPAGITANLLVRRDAFNGVGGFERGIKSAGDVELCWRLQEAGWRLEHRPDAVVDHVHPDSLRPLLRKAFRYGSGLRWLGHRYPRAGARPPLARPLARAALGGAGWPLVGQPRRGLYKLIDGAWTVALVGGYLAGDNRAVAHG